jgi:hypothetical protein
LKTSHQNFSQQQAQQQAYAQASPQQLMMMQYMVRTLLPRSCSITHIFCFVDAPAANVFACSDTNALGNARGRTCLREREAIPQNNDEAAGKTKT